MKPEERESDAVKERKRKRKMAVIFVGKMERCYWMVIPRGDADVVSPFHSIVSPQLDNL